MGFLNLLRKPMITGRLKTVITNYGFIIQHEDVRMAVVSVAVQLSQ